MEKIKLFEEFIKESYKSGKLREIIKQNGYPTFFRDKRLLHDIQDRDILCVLDNREEFYSKKFGENKDENFENTFIITLQNEKVLVIKNFDAYKSYIDDEEKQFRDKIDREISKRRGYNDKVHIDKFAQKRKNSVYNEQERKKFLNGFLTDERKKQISEKIENEISLNFDDGYEGHHTEEIETFKIDGVDISIFVDYLVSYGDKYVKFGAVYGDIECSIEDIKIYFDDESFEADGFDDNIYSGETEFERKDVEFEIIDYNKYYGVKDSDFF